MSKPKKKGKGKIFIIFIVAVVLILIFFAAIGGDDSTETDDYSTEVTEESSYNNGTGYVFGPLKTDLADYEHPYGLAVRCEGTILIYTTFLNDNEQTWDFDGEDAKSYNHMKDNLRIATQFITDEAAKYGKEVKFIYDWDADPDLADVIYMDGNYSSMQSPGNDIGAFIWENNREKLNLLVDRYQPDNLIVVNFTDSPVGDKGICNTTFRGSNGGTDLEVVNIKARCKKGYQGAATVAHEIFHTFGVPDTYHASAADRDVIISQDYVDYLTANNSNEIMYIQYDQATGMFNLDEVTNDLDDLTAYYLGWTDTSETKDAWGFNDRYMPEN